MSGITNEHHKFQRNVFKLLILLKKNSRKNPKELLNQSFQKEFFQAKIIDYAARFLENAIEYAGILMRNYITS